MNKQASQLEQGARALGVHLDAATVARMLAYVALLERWNRRFNLTAIRDRAAMIPGHLLDSLAIAPRLHGRRIADVGSGAGLPGLVLAMALPGIDVLMLDSNGKKTRFVREALRVLELANAAVVQSRVEDYRPEAGFDTVVCRAFAPLPRIVELAGHLCDPDGIILAQKGRYPADEIDAVPAGWEIEVAPLSVPGLDKERHAVTLRRRGAPG